jgi:hypothetical protein
MDDGDPRRLKDEAESTVELLLLEAGASYRSSPETRARTLAALGLAGSAVVSAGAAGVLSSFASKLGWGKVLLLSSIGAGVIAPVGYVTWNRLHSGREESAKVVAAPPVSPSPTVTSTPAITPPPALTPEQQAEPEVTAAVAKPEAKPACKTALSAELGSLDAARAKLGAGDASGALAQLDDYSRSYPRGCLVLEAEVLRIDALAKSGQKAAAKKRAEAFLRRHPNSVLASRVRGYLN